MALQQLGKNLRGIAINKWTNVTDFDCDDAPTKMFVYPKLSKCTSLKNERSLEELSFSKSSKDSDEHMKMSWTIGK